MISTAVKVVSKSEGLCIHRVLSSKGTLTLVKQLELGVPI